MNDKTAETIAHYVEELISEGQEVSEKKFPLRGNYGANGPPIYVDLELFSKWIAKCHHLAELLGEHATPWKSVLLSDAQNSHAAALCLLGTLQAIRDTLRGGLLIRLDQLVRAETFSDLLDQADYLLAETYVVAAGVLGRAVLEEHLRRWCATAGCTLARDRPTLAHYNMALYNAKHIDKPTMKHVEALIAIGNDAAHNVRDLQKADVERLLRDVRELLVRYPA